MKWSSIVCFWVNKTNCNSDNNCKYAENKIFFYWHFIFSWLASFCIYPINNVPSAHVGFVTMLATTEIKILCFSESFHLYLVKINTRMPTLSAEKRKFIAKRGTNHAPSPVRPNKYITGATKNPASTAPIRSATCPNIVSHMSERAMCLNGNEPNRFAGRPITTRLSV